MLAFCLSLSPLWWGCATTMQTAERLQSGDIVVSGALDLPGLLYVPRLSGQLLIGASDRRLPMAEDPWGFIDYTPTTDPTSAHHGGARL